MNFKKVWLKSKVIRCLINAFKFHIKLETIIYNCITEDTLLITQNIKEINNELDVLTLKLYNQNNKLN